MIKQMNYDPAFINIMTELAAINPQLIFKHEDDKVTVKAIDIKNKSICYFLDAPSTAFNFESDSFAVIDFNRLVSYYKTFNVVGKTDELSDTPELSVEYTDDSNEAIVLHIKSSKTKAEFKHRLANEEVIIKPNFNKIKFPSTDTSFKIDEKELTHIIKMLKLTGADRIKWAFSGSVCTVTLFNTRTNDTFESELPIETVIETPFEFVTVSDGVNLLPNGSYKIVVSKAGIMSFTQIREDEINLELYIAKTGR